MDTLVHVFYALRVIDFAKLRLSCMHMRSVINDHLMWNARDWPAMLCLCRVKVQTNGAAWWEVRVGCPLPEDEWHRLVPRSNVEIMCRLVPRQITSVQNIFCNHSLVMSVIPYMSRVLALELCSTVGSYPIRLGRWQMIDIISSLMCSRSDLVSDGTHAWFSLPPYVADPVIYTYITCGGCLKAVRDGVTSVYAHLLARPKQAPDYVLDAVKKVSRITARIS